MSVSAEVLRFRLVDETGLSVAEAEGPGAFEEIMHYRIMYSQDGEHKIEQKVGRKWLHVSGIGPVMTLKGST